MLLNNFLNSTVADIVYLRLDGTTVPTANIGWGGYDLTNIGSLEAVTGTFTGTGASTFNQGLIVNESGGSTTADDFRVESVSQSSAIFLDASEDLLNIGVNMNLGSNNLTTTGKVTTGGGRIINTTRYTTTQIIPVTDHAVFADTDGGAWTATLPAGVDGQEFFITNCGASGNALTIACNGAETLNGETTQMLFDSDSAHLIFETTEKWRVM